MPSLDAVLAALARIAGGDAPPHEPAEEDFFRGHELLRAQTESVLGPTPHNRAVRVMVTMPSEAATSYNLVRSLVFAGMDVARINCAHDDVAVWRRMAEHVRSAATETGRSCRVCLDLGGPRSRVRSTTIPHDRRVQREERLLLTSRAVPVRSRWKLQLECSLPEAVGQLEPGDEVWVNEGRLGAVVEGSSSEGVLLRVTEARDKGSACGRVRGSTSPRPSSDLSPLTARTWRSLDVVARVADIVGYSFVQRPDDIDLLREELAPLAGCRPPSGVDRKDRNPRRRPQSSRAHRAWSGAIHSG